MKPVNNEEIVYKQNNSINLAELTELYNSVGWTSYTDHPDIMEKLLPGALDYVSVWSGEKLIGLIRTVGDGCYILYIQDILIHPDFQRKGIGSELVRRILNQSKDIRQIILTTDNTEKTKAFYQSLGFVPMQETGAVSFIKTS